MPMETPTTTPIPGPTRATWQVPGTTIFKANPLTHHQLFIDQPTTVGLSYSIPIPAYQDSTGNIIQLPDETCPDYAQEVGTCGTYSKSDISLVPNSTQNAAPNMWKTLQGFMGAFPHYSRNGFSFTTESYGGHYGPVFNGAGNVP